MAQVWIEKIIRHSPHELRLRQNDPTFSPGVAPVRWTVNCFRGSQVLTGAPSRRIGR